MLGYKCVPSYGNHQPGPTQAGTFYVKRRKGSRNSHIILVLKAKILRVRKYRWGRPKAFFKTLAGMSLLPGIKARAESGPGRALQGPLKARCTWLSYWLLVRGGGLEAMSYRIAPLNV